MKKFKIGMTVLITVLFVCLMTMGCDPGEKIIIRTNPVKGKVLILQAYGNGSGGTPAGVSHSFVELYNITDAPVSLNDVTLWFADGVRYKVSEGAPLTDGVWKSISLNGHTIPAKSSFLILGKKHEEANSATRLTLDDDSGDINNNSLELSRRGFKVALIYGANELSISYQNPFTDGVDGPITGYVDMVGAVNNPNESQQGDKDQILGFETAPARNSASEAARRKNLIDTDNNAADFMRTRYGSGPADNDNYPSLTDEGVEACRPRNTNNGSWNPVYVIEEPDLTDVDYSKLILNEISGEHKFVEIYNSGSEDIPLYNLKLQRNDGPEEGGSEWTGGVSDSIPAGAYRIFLFNGYTASLSSNPAYTGWNVSSGISDQQILKVALIDPDGDTVDAFIRGNNPVPEWGNNVNIERNRQQSYSRMSDGSWAYADITPGAENGTKVRDIVFPGYLTHLRTDPPVITAFSRNIPLPTEDDAVTVSVTVMAQTTAIESVVLKWTLDGDPQTDKNMTPSGSVYTGTIPEQENDKEISYTVVAINDNGDISCISDGYTVGPPDYTQLVLNEVNGVEKWFEIYNKGDVDINLKDVKAYYNSGTSYTLTWTGLESQIVSAGGYIVIEQDQVNGATTGKFTTGLSANNANVKLQLRNPGEEVLDTYEKTPDYAPASGTPLRDKSHARIPDGTGDWYFTTDDVGTPGASNGSDTTGCTKFGEE